MHPPLKFSETAHHRMLAIPGYRVAGLGLEPKTRRLLVGILNDRPFLRQVVENSKTILISALRTHIPRVLTPPALPAPALCQDGMAQAQVAG